MATTVEALIGRRITIDPADSRGPWTIELPAPGIPDPEGNPVYNGATVWIKRTTLGTDPVTIRARGTSRLEDPFYGGLSAEFVWRGRGECLEIVYNGALVTPADPTAQEAPRDTWMFYGNYNPAQPVPQTGQWTGSLVLTTSEQLLPLSAFGPPNDDRYTIVGGELVANYDMALIQHINGSVKASYSAGSNNQEAQAYAGFRLRQGSGTELGQILNIDDTFAFQSSRSGTWDVGLQPSALMYPKEGNIISLVSFQNAATSMTATALEALAIV